MKKVEIDYEGMGTHVEATIFIDSNPICVIGSSSEKYNVTTVEIVNVVKEYLDRKIKNTPLKKRRQDG